jgi:hypothetical protein
LLSGSSHVIVCRTSVASAGTIRAMPSYGAGLAHNGFLTDRSENPDMLARIVIVLLLFRVRVPDRVIQYLFDRALAGRGGAKSMARPDRTRPPPPPARMNGGQSS